MQPILPDRTDGAETPGFVRDFISGELIRATPEEVEAVQVLARRLVEDYGYSPAHIQTRPQFRVRRRPSDEERSYPVDIAVFRSSERTEDSLFLVAECKKRSRKEGLAQLKLYMDMSPAEVGVWFNGLDHIYLRKVVHRDGRRTYQELPNIPRQGQRIEDIGLFQRRDLRKPSNLRAVFRDIRNHLAGNMTGITRDESLAQEIIALLFCKIYDEVNTGPHELVRFRSGQAEDAESVRGRIEELFQDVKREYSDVFSQNETIGLDAVSIVYVVGELQNYCVIEADRDAVGDAFEVFIGPALRGSEGQFFTPRNVVRMIIDILDPEPGEMLLDPACGSGGFLIMALERVWEKLEATAREKGWSDVLLDRRRREIASRCFRGIDKDSFLAKVTKAYMAIMGDGRGGIFCENSLLPPSEWHPTTRAAISLNAFDVVLTNPPFGSKIPVKGQTVLAQFDLGYKWKRSREARVAERTSTVHEDQPPQILFLERCLQFLKPRGRLGIVLPESILGNPSYEYVIAWLFRSTRIRAIVTMPESLFKTSGKGGTHTKVCILAVERTDSPIEEDYSVFMADARWCGHDSRGNPTIRKDTSGQAVLLDDVPIIAQKYRRASQELPMEWDHLGFQLRRSEIRDNILVPKYYNPELRRKLRKLEQTHELIRIGDLVQTGVIQITTGVEVGKMAYGTGPIPFIRTSDISNWELKADPKHGVSEDLFETLSRKVDVQPGDILLVRDGTYLIGTSAIVTESDTRMLFQSHIFKIRVLDPDTCNRWLLFASLNTPIVKAQIRAMQFTQDIIDTLGNRVLDLLLPMPREDRARQEIAAETQSIVETRAALRNKARALALAVEGEEHLIEEEVEAFDTL